jgi:predicted RNA-binding Zn-ribbon protein involved in translation (DUF1610 family)
MQCVNCDNAIKAGMEISLPSDSGSICHCPYCLHVQPSPCSSEADDESPATANVSVGRFERRRDARERFVDELLESSEDGTLRCPGCDHRLHKNDELALRSAEQFSCPNCGDDLAERAYLAVAYDEDRWLPVIAALSETLQTPRCAECSGCAYMGAVATACRRALSCMSKPFPTETQLLERLLARTTWSLPACDQSGDCTAAKEYRKLAADGIALL